MEVDQTATLKVPDQAAILDFVPPGLRPSEVASTTIGAARIGLEGKSKWKSATTASCKKKLFSI